MKTRLECGGLRRSLRSCGRRREGARRGSVILGLLALMVAGLLAVIGMFRTSSDVATLRDSVMKDSGGQWEKQVQLGLGWVPFTAAHLALACTDVEAPVRDVVGSLRGVDVGVYECRGPRTAATRSVLVNADAAMSRRGWYRAVGVVEGGQVVGIYVPAHAKVDRDLGVCVVVLDQSQLVVVSARCDPRPLVAMALREQGRVDGLKFKSDLAWR